MINLTIQSLNNKTVSAIDLTNNTVMATFNQSQTQALNYTNIYLKVGSADTFTMENLGHIVRQPLNDPIFMVVGFLLIICAISFTLFFRRKR